jgi:hypothetical protein
MRRYKRGTARSGRKGRGGKVKSRKQAIAIGLSKARKKGKKVPRKKSAALRPTKGMPSPRLTEEDSSSASNGELRGTFASFATLFSVTSYAKS